MTRLASFVARTQHQFATALGVDEGQRSATVISMLENNRRRAPGYWIQLFLSMGIATLGLVLNSTAVVIGAMLVSPLMGPILEMGMGFAIGSPFLVLRASLRVGLSVIVVVASAAVLTLALPFHEVTAEVAARAAPTALDLLVAVFCALTAAYTTVRSTSDTTTAAAGTAIGIALVPPLCACGFGVGVGNWTVAGGAALLFTANLSAILLFAVASFFVLGYNQVDAGLLDSSMTDGDGTRTGELAFKVEAWLHLAFGSRYGWAMRILIPVFFLGAVFLPLRSALTEVTWEVRTRDGIRSVLAAEAPQAVQTVLTLDHRAITLHLVVVGSVERATALEKALQAHIEERTGVRPVVTVIAVPATRSLAAAKSRADAATTSSAPLEVSDLRQRINTALDRSWPSAVAGPLLEWEVAVAMSGAPTITTRHIGDALGKPGEAILARALTQELGAEMEIDDAALARGGAARALGEERAWSGEAAPILAWIARSRSVIGCVRAPVSPTRHPGAAQRALLAMLDTYGRRVVVTDSSGWSIRVARAGPCDAAAKSPSE